MKRASNLTALTAALSLSIPFTAAAQTTRPLQTSKTLLTQEMERVGCVPPPEDIYFKPGITQDQGITRNFLIDYCGQTMRLANSLVNEFTDISRLNAYEAVLALRAVPVEQKDERDRMAKAAAIDLARAAVDYAFSSQAVVKDPLLAQSYKNLSRSLDRLPQASAAERAQIGRDAYQLRLTLERKGYKYHYNQAAYAVTMAANASDLGHTNLTAASATDKEWLSLYGAAAALDSTYIYSGAASTNGQSGNYQGYNIWHTRHADRAADIVGRVLSKYLAPQQP